MRRSGWLLVFSLLAVGMTPAQATPELAANDLFQNAIPVETFPFVHGVSNTLAMTEEDEPTPCGQTRTVWYQIETETPLDFSVITNGSNVPIAIALYDGSTLDNLRTIKCERTDLYASVKPGRYFLQVGSYSTTGSVTGSPLVGTADPTLGARGTLRVVFSTEPNGFWYMRGARVPLDNDAIADAAPLNIGGWGYETLYPASIEEGEPTDCLPRNWLTGEPRTDDSGSAWYRFAPDRETSVSLVSYNMRGYGGASSVGVYRETPGGLEFVKCDHGGEPYPWTLLDYTFTHLDVRPGEVYLLQLATVAFARNGSTSLRIDELPDADYGVESVHLSQHADDPTRFDLRMAFTYEGDPSPAASASFQYELWQCPTGAHASFGCDRGPGGTVRISAADDGSKVVTTEWFDGYCAGDVELRIKVIPVSARDTDSGNDQASLIHRRVPVSSPAGGCYPWDRYGLILS